MLRSRAAKVLALYLVVAMLILSLPASGWAMIVPTSSDVRSADLAAVRTTLESSLIRQRLLDFGLTPEETNARLGALSGEQLHRLAADLNAVQAGGSVVSDVILILLVVIIVIAVLELTGHHVVMRR